MWQHRQELHKAPYKTWALSRSEGNQEAPEAVHADVPNPRTAFDSVVDLSLKYTCNAAEPHGSKQYCLFY